MPRICTYVFLNVYRYIQMYLNICHFLGLSLGIWENLIAESEISDYDSTAISRKLSFRATTKSGRGRRPPSRDPSRSDSPPIQGLPENEKKIIINEQKSLTLSMLEKNIPQFKYAAVKDLYMFLLKRRDCCIDASQVNEFWDIFPAHRKEIGT
jgi:hypothetical protein